MSDDLCLDPAALEAHATRLARIASQVEAVGKAASLRVGDGDYGAAFGWFASIVNEMLAGTEESINNHGDDLQKNVSAFRYTISHYVSTDRSGAAEVNRAGS